MGASQSFGAGVAMRPADVESNRSLPADSTPSHNGPCWFRVNSEGYNLGCQAVLDEILTFNVVTLNLPPRTNRTTDYLLVGHAAQPN